MSTVPVIDVGSLVSGVGDLYEPSSAIARACKDNGFFYITNHGVDEDMLIRLERLSQQFFEQDLATKLEIRMELGGRAWRGYFPVGDELTSGKPDVKEGLYFGSELDDDDDRVKKGVPMHGPNLFPDDLPEFKETVLEYMNALSELGHAVMTGIALSLGLDRWYFRQRYMSDPFILFRVFHYPPASEGVDGTVDAAPVPTEPPWGVGEHTDYGVLTILKQDQTGGLQVKSKSGWIDAPPLEGTLVCNIGDMLDRMTQGVYRSTPHRVLNVSGRGRLSFPFFFDPNFDARIEPIGLVGMTNPADDKDERWDRASVHEFEGTYGDYILRKVSKVFPQLRV